MADETRTEAETRASDTAPAGQGANRDQTAVPAPVIENQQDFERLRALLSYEMLKEIDEKLARRRTTILTIISIIALFIVGGGGYFASLYIELQTNAKIGEISKQLDDKVEDINNNSEFLIQNTEFLPRTTALAIQLQKMDEDTGVNRDSFEDSIEEFKYLYSHFIKPYTDDDGNIDPQKSQGLDFQTIRDRESALADHFDLIVSIMGDLGRKQDIEELRNFAPNFDGSSVFLLVTLQSYGRDVLGAAGAPDSWRDGGLYHETYGKYRESSASAEERGYPELQLLFNPIIWYMEGKDADDIEQLLDDVDALNDADGGNYEELLARLASQDFAREPNAQSRRIANRTTAFIRAYQNESVRVKKVAGRLGIDPR
ncbi:MAG: hypothetical protein GDA36_02920 [Rhodobacteraceae bacterium]|nr:hypothetical protein [Paracoccaceae bacterium]